MKKTGEMSKKKQQTKAKAEQGKQQETENGQNEQARVDPENTKKHTNGQYKQEEKKNNDAANVKLENVEKEKDQAVENTDKQETEQVSTEELEKLVQEWRDKYMRLSAEFDNYRKRTLKEKIELAKTAGEETLTDLLPVMDDFERAMQSMDNSEDVQALKDGVHLIYGKFHDFLSQKGVKEIEAKEQEFNTDLHDAITKVPAPSEELKGKIVDVVQKGYTLNDKVIRYAKVVIGE